MLIIQWKYVINVVVLFYFVLFQLITWLTAGLLYRCYGKHSMCMLNKQVKDSDQLSELECDIV